MISVSDWKKGIQTQSQSVSNWSQSRQPTATVTQPVQQDISLFDKIKGFGSSALQGIKQVPSYVSQAVQNPVTTGQGIVSTGVLKPLGFLTDIGTYVLNLEKKGLNKIGIKTKPEEKNVFSELSTVMDDLQRSGNEKKAYDTGNFLGYLLPYSRVAKGTQLTLESLKLAPKVAKYIPAVADAVGFLGTGQILYDEKNGTRIDQLKNDAIGLALFSGGGFLLGKSGALTRNGFKKVLSNKAKDEVVTIMKPVANRLESGKKVPSSVLDEAVTKANNVVIQDTGKTTKELLLDSLERQSTKRALKTKEVVRKAELTKELAPTTKISSLLARVKNVSSKEKVSINRNEKGTRKQARLKASGFEVSAIKRGLERKPTKIEFANAKKKLEANYKGKKVKIVSGGTGEVVGVAFGKIRVKSKNGEVRSIAPADIIKVPVTNKLVLDKLEQNALSKLRGKESLLGIKVKKESPKTTKKESAKKSNKPKNASKKDDVTFVPTETKSSLAQSIKRKAIKEKMILGFDKRFNDLPKLERRIKKEDIKKTDEFTLNNPNEAFKVAMGEKPAPAGMLPEDVLVSVTNYASATGNVEAMRKLANESGLLQESRLLGQRIQAFSQLNPVIGHIKDVAKARQDRVPNYDKKKASIVKNLKKTKVEKDQLNWDKFINEITC